MLKADHDKVKSLLAELETRARDQRTDRAVLDDQGRADGPRDHRGGDLLPELKAHPKAKDIVLEGYQEHHVVDLLMGELEELDVTDETWGAKAIVMKENIEHHIEEEEATCS